MAARRSARVKLFCQQLFERIDFLVTLRQELLEPGILLRQYLDSIPTME